MVTTVGHDAGQAGQDGRRTKRAKGAIVTISAVAALLAAMGLTVLGLGAADNAVANYDASSWLWSAAQERDGPGQRRHRPGRHPAAGAAGASGTPMQVSPDRPVC